jgi:hypothetical protein
MELMRNVPAKISVRVARLILGTVSVLAIAACGSNTAIEQQWTAPAAQAAHLKKVAVVLLSSNTTLRHSTEDAMVQQLAKTGTQAVAGYTVLDEENVQDRAGAKARLLAAGFDGVLTMRLVSANQQVNAVPGDFDGYWGMGWGPGYLETETIVRVESNAYSLKNSKLLWTGLSKTIDPNNTSDLIASVTKVIAKELEQKGIVV